MPLKVRFHLEGEAPSDPHQHAKGLRALVLSWIRESDPASSQALHEANQPKPYSISPLYRGQINREGRTRSDCFFELGILVDKLYEPISEGIEQQGGGIRLGTQSYRLRDIEVYRQQSYEELLELAPILPREFRLRMQTPTAIHRGAEVRKAIVLPSPELYFGNWWTRWNLCSAWQIPREMLEVVERQVVVTYCKGGTQTARLDNERNFVGFVGDVTFGLLKPEGVEPAMRKALSVLTLFSEYCGTGVDTMRGMGETLLMDIPIRS